MSINLNGLVPSPPAGTVNAQWQEDTSGNVSCNVPSSLVAAVDRTQLHVNISGTLFTTVASGQYRIGSYIVVTNPSFYGVLPNVIIGWTDLDTGVVESNFVTDSIPGTTLGAYVSGEMRVSCQSATNITYSTTGYGSYNQYGDLIYAIHLTCELV